MDSAKTFLKSIINKYGWDVHRYVPRLKDARKMLLLQKKIDLALDIGGYVGGHAIELRQDGYSGTIVSFEPVLEAFLQMREQSDKDPLWESFQLALGSKGGTTNINVGNKTYTSSVLTYGLAYKELDTRLKSEPQDAQMVRLDSWVETSPWSENRIFIKLDVQGYEKECLEGAKGILSKVEIIQCELSFVELYTGSWMFREALDWFERNGFNLYQIERGFQDIQQARLLQVDGLFVRP